MRRVCSIVALLAVPALVGASVYVLRARTFSHRLAESRAHLGTEQASALLELLNQSYPDNPEVTLLRARQFRLMGQRDAAVAELRRLAERGYPAGMVDRELLLVRADKEFREVEPALQSLLDGDPNDRDVLLALALGWARLQNLERADALLQPVLQRNPNDGAAWWIRGRVRLQKHLAHVAHDDLEKSIALGEDAYYATDAHFLLANCRLELGRFSEALVAFQFCLARAPDNPKYLFGVGRSAWYLNRTDEAEAAFQKLLLVRPDHLDALSQLAYINEERGRLAEALELLERAAQADPTWYDLHFRMAKLLRALGKTDRAAESERRAAALQQRWARPRPSSSASVNAYTGEELAPGHSALDDE
jgi:tetratricopeptide (TPR) repeat protein